MYGFIATILLLISLSINIVQAIYKSKGSGNSGVQLAKVHVGDEEGTVWNKRALIAFLERADDAYMMAFETRKIEYFSSYCTVPCAQEVFNRIVYYNDKQDFGIQTSRQRAWVIIKTDESGILIKKEISHTRDSHTKITAGDSFAEYWRVIYNGAFAVAQIRK